MLIQAPAEIQVRNLVVKFMGLQVVGAAIRIRAARHQGPFVSATPISVDQGNSDKLFE